MGEGIEGEETPGNRDRDGEGNGFKFPTMLHFAWLQRREKLASPVVGERKERLA